MPHKSKACAALLPLALCAGCHRPVAAGFPEHAELHLRAEYASGSGAALYVGRLHGNEGRTEFLRELDGHLSLLRELLAARARLDATAGTAQPVRDEQARLDREAARTGRLLREFLDLAVASRLVEVIPELAEALRLAAGSPPAPGFDATTLRERQRMLGTGPARCGAEHPDPLAGPHPPPPFFLMARDAVDEQGQEVVLDEKQRERAARIVNASQAQRQAMGQYGPFETINKGPAKGESWRFRIGSVGQASGIGRPLDQRLRSIVIDCEFDERGELRGGQETVFDEHGAKIRL